MSESINQDVKIVCKIRRLIGLCKAWTDWVEAKPRGSRGKAPGSRLLGFNHIQGPKEPKSAFWGPVTFSQVLFFPPFSIFSAIRDFFFPGSGAPVDFEGLPLASICSQLLNYLSKRLISMKKKGEAAFTTNIKKQKWHITSSSSNPHSGSIYHSTRATHIFHNVG